MVEPLTDRSRSFILLAGRILMAVVFMPSGFVKLAGLGAFAATLEARGLPAPNLLALIGGATEFFGALAVLLGLKMRYAAMLMIAFVIVATAISHRYWEFADPVLYRFQRSAFFKNIAIVAGFAFLMAAGAGRLSLDAWMEGRKG
ncbi:MAG TPA: DoxX family protein [Pseudorhodoplanes sp.]|jgi:putative oxidoreductase|nr:DoxX family protein [Pseudorhodoplanes sp.]